MHDHIEASLPPVVLDSPREGRRTGKAPTLGEQLAGVFTEPVALFQRLGETPRWGQALWAMIFVAWFMMGVWAWSVDVDAMQRPILERNAQLTASQIDQAVDVSTRFILPMSVVSAAVRNLFAVLGLGLVFWLFAMTTAKTRKSTFLHAVSAATVPNLVLLPYTIMIAVVCLARPIGGQIPERLAPSGLAYYLRPDNPKVYALLAQCDPFIIGYFVMLFLAVRHTMKMKTRDAVLCTSLAVLLTVGWKVYFWV